MTLRDELPIHRCAVKGCAFIGRWPEGGLCPDHRLNPLTDRPVGRAATLAEAWEVDDAPQD